MTALQKFINGLKKDVDNGKDLRWSNTGYKVIKDSSGDYLIQWTKTGDCIGLTNKAGDKLNGNPGQFFKVVQP